MFNWKMGTRVGLERRVSYLLAVLNLLSRTIPKELQLLEAFLKGLTRCLVRIIPFTSWVKLVTL